MNKLDKQYIALLNDILANGVRKEDRTGTGTISVFGRQIRHKMSEGFPLLTTKKMPFKTIVTELLWFLRGDTNIKFLVDNNCHIWDGDAYKRYSNSTETSEYDGVGPTSIKLPTLTQEEFVNKIKTDDEFAKEWGELGPIYGAQWRNWNGRGTDQIQNLINDLKNNPDSRRLMVNAWNVGELNQMVLPPCHYGFQVYTRELSFDERWSLYSDKPYDGNGLGMINTLDYLDDKNIPTRAISLMWNQRSVDTFLGLPFNIASYGLLLEIIAREVNMVPDELIGNLGDVHLYSNHIEPAIEQIGGPLDHEKRAELLKEAMGLEAFEKAVSELVPFGGGMSEYYQAYKIPYSTREPYPLPSLKIMDYDSTLSVIENLEHWTPTDFVIENYQSHPTIKAPLSN
jgi:thymidylate synthase